MDGNPLHPVSGGRLCPRGHAALQSLYHPDRLQAPLRRTGNRGSIESFERASWEEALGEIGERLRLLRQVGRPESLALIRTADRGIGARLAERFLQAFGSPNDIGLQRGEEAGALALLFSQGVRTPPAYDVQSTDYVLSLGAALLEAWSSPVHMMRAYGEFRQGRPGRRGKLVQVEPRLSITGSSADEWIAVRPGSEGIFALGIARVLVAENLYDKDFVRQLTVGFEDFRDAAGHSHEGLHTFLDRRYRLERVAAETGVSGNIILRLAREFAAARNQLAVAARKGPLLPGGLFEQMAAHVLNALMGNLDHPGGTLVPEATPISAWPDLPEDPVAIEGLTSPRLDGAGSEAKPFLKSDPEAFAEEIVSGARYPLEVLFLLEADPVLASMAPDLFARAIEKTPMVVSMASIADDSALMADWILPLSHFLEDWDLDTSPPGVPYPMVSLVRPAAEKEPSGPRSAAEIIFALAREVGNEVAGAFPWTDAASLIQSDVEALHGARRGAAMGTEFDEAWVRMMERAGWWAPGYRSPQELWQRLQETGGWWDPFYDHEDWRRVLQTDSGRFEFRVDLLRVLSESRAVHPVAAISSEAGRAERTEVEGESPLLALLLFEPLPIAGGTGAELPFLQELLDPGLEQRWETWAEVHPATAELFGLRDRDWIRLTSDQGSIEVRARVTPRVVPGAAAVPVGLGKRGGGRWARGRGANPLRLLAPAREPISALPDLGATRVRLSVLGRGRARQVSTGR